MRVIGFVDVARSAGATALRGLVAVPLWLAEALAVGADLIDPKMPETLFRPREWMPRLWTRTGGRTANEARD